MPAISVIVPVYRAERFLDACVESVLAQTFTDWELLLIEDGSPDGSGALCDAFHKENGGVSSARNVGLAHAEGECIAFLDSDDGFEPETLETLWELRRRNGTDTAGCAQCSFDKTHSDLSLYILNFDRAYSRSFAILPNPHREIKSILVKKCCHLGIFAVLWNSLTLEAP